VEAAGREDGESATLLPPEERILNLGTHRIKDGCISAQAASRLLDQGVEGAPDEV
jgi:hypothetical protein